MTNKLLDISSPVYFSRGALLMEHIAEYSVRVLEFPFYEVLDILYATRNTLLEADGKKVVWDRNAPTDSLNEFLLYLCPVLVHPFVMNYRATSKQLNRSRIYQSPMFAIGVPQFGNSAPEPIPSTILKQVMKIWLREVAVPQMFQGYTDRQTTLDAVNEANDSIDRAIVNWELVSIAELLEYRKDNEIGYGALQSLLAVVFIQQANQAQMTLGGQPIEWRATREDRHFEPVTQHIAHKVTGDVFAYHISIELRDMPGRDQPLVYVVPHMRRYISRQVKSRNDERDIRVMVEYPNPLSKHIPEASQIKVQSPLYITEKLRTEKDKSPVEYRNHLPQLISTFIGVTKGNTDAVVDAFELLANPAKYREPKPAWRNAIYLPIFADGIDQSGKTADLAKGLPLNECVGIVDAFSSYLQGWYQPDQPLCRLNTATYSTEDIYDEAKPIKALFSIGGVHDLIWLNKKPKVSYRSLNLPEYIPDRLKMALGGKKLVVLLIAETANARIAMDDMVRSVIGCTSREVPLPSNVVIKSIETPLEFRYSVVNWHNLYEESDASEKRKYKDKGWREDITRVCRWIEDARLKDDPDATYLAIIERPSKPTFDASFADRKEDNAKKSTLRAAFGLAGIRSQMIREFPHDDVNGLQKRNFYNVDDRARLEHAVANGIILQSGMTYGAPQEMYEALGFPSQFAQRIVVEYWVRVRSTNTKTDFIAIARKSGDGYVEIIFPDLSTGTPLRPMTVHEANLYVQSIFTENDKKYRSFTPNNKDNRLRQFLRSMLIRRDTPTLIVMNVTDWNSGGTRLLGDLDFTQNELCIQEDEDSYTPKDLENVRIVKMLNSDRFNMRYWEWMDKKPQMIDELAAIYDDVATIPTLYSIAPQPKDYDDAMENAPSNVEAGKVFFQRSRVIEFAGAMMQPEDATLEEQLRWCAIPHLDRINPAWKRGVTLYPHPYHIVEKMVDDAMWANILSLD